MKCQYLMTTKCASKKSFREMKRRILLSPELLNFKLGTTVHKIIILNTRMFTLMKSDNLILLASSTGGWDPTVNVQYTELQLLSNRKNECSG